MSLTGSTLSEVLAFTKRPLKVHTVLPDGKAYIFDTDESAVYVSQTTHDQLAKFPGLAHIVLVDEVRISMINSCFKWSPLPEGGVWRGD